MHLRGVARVLTHTEWGLGFRSVDRARPDKGPSRPGYVWVSSSSIDPPPPPQFVSVDAGGGMITVVLSCPETVDGYHVGLSGSAVLPPSTWGSTTSGTWSVTAPSGTYYVHARTYRGGMVSTWSVWGGTSPGEDEWRLVYEDQTVSNTAKIEYPGLTEDEGGAVIYAGGGAGPYGYLNNNNFGGAGEDPTKARFTSFFLGEFGGRYRFKFRDGATSAYTRVVGVVFACSGASSDYYVMAVCCGAGTYTPYMRLYKSVSGSLTLVSEVEITASGYDTETSGGITAKVFTCDFQARENAFKGYSKGVKFIDVEDASIPWLESSVHAGLYFDSEPWASVVNIGICDYLEIYARDRNGEPVAVDPGAAADSLREGNLAAPFNLSHYVRWCSGNAALDYLHVRVDDTTPQRLLVDRYNPYNPDPDTPEETYEVAVGSGTEASLAIWSSDGQFLGDSGITDDGSTVSFDRDLQLAADNAVYLGDASTDGTWKIVRAGDDLVFYRRESGSYVEKWRVTA